MKVALIDDENIALRNLEFKLKDIIPDAQITAFQDEDFYLQWMKTEQPDVTIMDIDMQPRNGLELAEEVKRLCPDIAIIFLTGHSEFAVDAFRLKANGYLLKPVSSEDLQHEFDCLRKDGLMLDRKKLQVRCFGSFEVFVDHTIIRFRRAKSKELFAYLIDRRGSSATMAEIASVLWSDGIFDHSRNNQIHSFLNDLNKSIESYGVYDVIIRERNAISVNLDAIACDYYQFLSGDQIAISAYNGEYMSQYWWAEFTAGEVYSKLTERNHKS